MSDPVAYAYEASIHCADCAEQRFGTNDQGKVAGTDNEGNEIAAIFSYDLEDDEFCDDCLEQIG